MCRGILWDCGYDRKLWRGGGRNPRAQFVDSWVGLLGDLAFLPPVIIGYISWLLLTQYSVLYM
jgi:hypothetical protein